MVVIFFLVFRTLMIHSQQFPNISFFGNYSYYVAHTIFSTCLSYKWKFVPFNHLHPTSTPTSSTSTNLISFPMKFLFKIPHMRLLFFSVCIISLKKHPQGPSILSILLQMMGFTFLKNTLIAFCFYIYYIFFNHLSVDGRLPVSLCQLL